MENNSPPLDAKTRRGRPPAGDSALKMADLLVAARAEFIRAGYRAATMDAIARRADLSKRTLYCWYADKAALFQACILDGGQHLPRPMPDPHHSLAEGLRAYAVALVSQLCTEPSWGITQLVAREGRDFPELAEATRRGHDLHLVRPLTAYLTRHGYMPAQAAEAAPLFIAMALADLDRALLLGLPIPASSRIDQHAAFITEVFLAGSQPRPATQQG